METFNIKDLILIGKAAKILCIDRQTLRTWDKIGKLKAIRHPITNYRYYKTEDIRKLMSFGKQLGK